MKYHRIVLTLVFFTTLLLRAQEGVLDPSFNTTGMVLTPVGTANDAMDIVVQSDGKIVVGGTATVGGVNYFTAARYTPAGVLDPSFGTDGIAMMSVGVSGAHVTGMALQPDGKILLCGSAVPSGSSIAGFAVARFTGSGQPDLTFGVNGSAIVITEDGCDPKGIALAPDGKIVLSGTSTAYVYSNSMVLVRFTSAGILDHSFNGSGIWLQYWFSGMRGYAVAVQPDGKIVTVGKEVDAGTIIFRLNADGSTDSDFGDPDWGGLFYEKGEIAYPGNLLLLPDGKILLSGYNDQYAIVERFTANGQYDNTFGVNGIAKVKGSSLFITAGELALQSDGYIAVACMEFNGGGPDAAVARFTPTGVPDTLFGTKGTVSIQYGTGNSFAVGIAVQSDDKIVIGGTFQDATRNTFAIARFIGSTGPALNYSSSGFREAIENDGTMSIMYPMSIMLRHDTLTGSIGDDFVASGKILVSNVPDGLNPVITKSSSVTLSVQLTGAAIDHTPANNVTGLSIAFQNSAFANHTADAVNNAVRADIGIEFISATPRTALRFDGTDDYIQVPAGVWFDGDCTIEAWVYPRSYHNWARLVDFGNGMPSDNVIVALSTGTAGTVSFHVFNGTTSKFITAPTPLPLNTWSHIACVLKSDGATIYINGILVVSGTVNIPANVTRTYNYIGKSGWDGDAYAEVTIDEVRIWNTPRPQHQIRENMFRSIDPGTEHLIGYWSMNDSLGTTASDRHGQHGMLRNFSMTAGSGWVASDRSSGPGTIGSAAAVTTGEFLIGPVRLSITEDFDYAVDLTATEVSAIPVVPPLGHSTVVGDRYFVINGFGTPGIFSADLTLNFGADQIDPRAEIFPEGVRLFRRNMFTDGEWEEIGGAVSADPVSGDVTWSGISSLGQFAAVYDESALPVELASFKAIIKNGSVELHWSTETEKNNYGFEIERSKRGNGRSEMWEKIGFVEGNGTTSAPKLYNFIDASVTGKVLYRLKQIDRDGKISYSNTVEATVAEVKQFGLEQNYPNPFNPSTAISYQLPVNCNVNLKVYDALGKEVATLVNEMKEAGNYNVQFNASQFASGVYFYRLNAGKFSAVKKLVLMK